MENSRYALRLAPSSSVLPSGRPLPHDDAEANPQLKTAPLEAAVAIQFPRVLPQEPDDARITGGTRSLSRRLLALNIPMPYLGRNPVANVLRNAPSRKAKMDRAMVAKPELVA